MAITSRFQEINDSFPKSAPIMDAMRQGKRVIGWLCTYVPEEIIHAAGALPVRITGYSQEVELEDGNAHLYINNCSFSRSCLQLGLQGEYDFLDGLVAGSTCDGARRLFDTWRAFVGTPFHHIITVPRKSNEKAHELYYRKVGQFKIELESYLETTIPDNALIDSIKLYNESRALLGRLYDLRKLDQPPITGAETMEVLNAGFRMPKELFNEYVRDLLQELEASKTMHAPRKRLMVVGSVMNNPDFIRFIEQSGALVVTDELCTSTRYWSDPVKLSDGTDPVRMLSERYLNNFPCARMHPSEARFTRVFDLIDQFKVDGVISEVIRYCVPYAHDLPLLTDRLKERGIPILALDVEYGASGSGQVQTRVQAFMEMLEAEKK